jgi:hypothetical protein
MRRLSAVTAFLFIAVFVATARDLTTLEPRTYYSIAINRVEKTGISITHRDGVVFLDFSILPGEVRVEFGYDAAKYQAGLVEKRQQEQAISIQQQAAAGSGELALQAPPTPTVSPSQASSDSSIVGRTYLSSPYPERNYSLPSYSTRSYSTVGSPVQVKGYFRKNGTYVRPHTRRAPSH